MDELTRVALLVEDEDSWTDLMGQMLGGGRYIVRKAENGRQALRIAREEKLAIAVVDLNLPDMFGLDLIRCLRELPGQESLPILVLTAYHREEIRDLTLDPAQGFISKDQGLTAIRRELDKTASPQ